jgi:hypothetical protein
MERWLRGAFPGHFTVEVVDTAAAAQTKVEGGFLPDVLLVAGRSAEPDGETGPKIITRLRCLYAGPMLEILASGAPGVHAAALEVLDKTRVVRRVSSPDFETLRGIFAEVVASKSV